MYKRMNPRDIELLFGINIPSYDGCTGKFKDGITEKQRTFIHSLGINITGLKYKGQASVIIECIIRRREQGLASIKQLQTLRNLKAKLPKPIQFITKDEASNILSKFLF